MRYEILGRRDDKASTVVLSAGLGGLGHFWRPQLEALGGHYRVIVYDQRGTGANASAFVTAVAAVFSRSTVHARSAVNDRRPPTVTDSTSTTAPPGPNTGTLIVRTSSVGTIGLS